MSAQHDDLAAFILDHVGTKPPSDPKADLFDKLGVHGDDASDFMERFALHFQVNMDAYRWYFHHGEEGINLGGLFFKPSAARVTHIPVTIALLEEAIAGRRWPLTYPDHDLPAVRWDLRLNLALPVVVALLLVGLALHFD